MPWAARIDCEKPLVTAVITWAAELPFRSTVVTSATVTIAATSGNAAIPVVTIRAANLRVVPLCPFIAAFIRRHHEYLDLVDERNRQHLRLEEAS